MMLKTLLREVDMKINKEQLAAMAVLPDDALWAQIVTIAKGYGFTLPTVTPPHEELEKLRGAVTGARLNVGDAMRILNNYKRGNGK